MTHRTLVRNTVLLAALLAGSSAFAQNASNGMTPSGDGYDGDGWFARPSAGGSTSYLPFTSNGYVGVSVGQSRYDIGCLDPFSCDRRATAFKLYTGGQLFRIAGLDLAYLNMGSVDHNGGSSRAQGLGLNAVGNLPIGDFNAFVKVGTTYGWTHTDSAAPTAASRSSRGFGLSYGAGVQYDLSRTLGARVEWERVRFRFADGRDTVSLLSAGLVLHF